MKHIFITGVTKGIGNAMARKFSEMGYFVSGTGRSRERLRSLENSCTGNSCFMECDIKNISDVNEKLSKIKDIAGTPEIVINNAGIINKNNHLWNVDPHEFESVIQTNITGSFYVIKFFTPLMIEKGKGIIVNMSSGWGRSVSPQVAPYCASKWAIEGLTGALALELPPGVSAVSLNPGVINTDMLKSCFGPSASSFRTPDDFAEDACSLILSITPEDNGRKLSV